jgi:membrane-associated phospholipid phosphatase
VAHFGGFSFPSGHAVQAVVVWGTLAALAAASTNAWPKKVGAWAAAGLVCVLVGLSRLYLGAHWLSDVGAGLTLGALWLSAVLVTARTTATLRSRRANAAGTPPD